jgi:hypothetical protein
MTKMSKKLYVGSAFRRTYRARRQVRLKPDPTYYLVGTSG